MRKTLLTGRIDYDELLLGVRFEERREKALEWLTDLVENAGEQYVKDHREDILFIVEHDGF